MNNSPKLISSNPPNNSTNISKYTSISLNFDKIIYTSNYGIILLKNYSSDETIEKININNIQIIGSGSKSITIHLYNPLSDFTRYYLLISPTCIKDNNDTYFNGINKSNILSFTTSKNILPNIINNSISSDFKFINISFNKEMFNRKGENLNHEQFKLNIIHSSNKLTSSIPISVQTNDNKNFKLEIKFINKPDGSEIIKIIPFSNNSIFDSDKNSWQNSIFIPLKNFINNSKNIITNNNNKNIINISNNNIRNNLFFDQNIIPKVFYNSTINRDKKSLFIDITNNPLISKQVIYFNQLNLHQAFNYKKQGKTYGTTKIPWQLETMNNLYMSYNEQSDFYLYINRVPFNQSNFSYLLMQIKNLLSQLAYAKNLFYTNKVISYKPDGSVITPRQLINLIKKFI